MTLLSRTNSRQRTTLPLRRCARQSQSRSRSRSRSRSNPEASTMDIDSDNSHSSPQSHSARDVISTPSSPSATSTESTSYLAAVRDCGPTRQRMRRRKRKRNRSPRRHRDRDHLPMDHATATPERSSERNEAPHIPQRAHSQNELIASDPFNTSNAASDAEDGCTAPTRSRTTSTPMDQDQNRTPSPHRTEPAVTEMESAGSSADDGLRAFRFRIEDDSNLQVLVDSNSASPSTAAVGPGPGTGPLAMGGGRVEFESLSSAAGEVSSEYILSKLYNYMKISEMSKYGIQVFEVTFSSYLPFLSEADLFRLASSYWCNGAHFNCMAAHRGDRIKPPPARAAPSATASLAASVSTMTASLFGDGHGAASSSKGAEGAAAVLSLEISDELLDAAMQSGASVDKIEAMLLQKRRDEGLRAKSAAMATRRGQRWRSRKDGKLWFFQTAEERAFYLRNLKHRFWNHEVLVRVFIQNGWMTPDLAEYAMKTFIKTIYHRVLQSKAPRPKSGGGVKLSEPFLQSFFADHFCLDDIPKMYRQEIRRQTLRRQRGGKGGGLKSHHLSEETLRRWCELIELLASRGAAVHCSEFGKMIPLQYALQIGRNTFKVISSSHKQKNKLLVPEQFHQENISVPDDIWDVLVSYL